MKKLLVGLLVLHFSLYAFSFNEAHAEGVSLKVAPPNIVIQTAAPAIIEKPIKIINKNDQSITLDIIYEPFTQRSGENGKVSFELNKDDFFRADPDIFQKITVLDNARAVKTITLSPKQEKTLTLRVNLAQNQPSSDYYFSILFVSKANQQESIRVYTSLEGAIGINVLLSIFTGSKQPEGFIDAYNIPFLLQNGPVPFEITFRNTGSYLLAPQGTVLIKNMFGQTVGKVTIPKTYVLAETTRVLSARWDEQFLFGPYTAELFLAISDSDTSFRRSTMFVGIPTGSLVGIIGVIIAIFVLRSRLRRYPTY